MRTRFSDVGRGRGAASIAIAVSLVGALLVPLVLSSPAGAAPAGAPEDWSPNYRTWMRDKADEIGSSALVDLPLPGTHQSITYDLGTRVAPDIPFDPTAMIEDAFDGVDCGFIDFLCDAILGAATDLADGFAGQSGKRWGTNQSKTITRQLNDGIRYLDFRVCKDRGPTGLVFRGCHGVFTNGPIQHYLGQLRDFLASYDEFVVLKLRAVDSAEGDSEDDWATEDLDALAKELRRIFGDLVITREDAVTETLDTLWADGPGRLIISSDTAGLVTAATDSSSGTDVHYVHPQSEVVDSNYTEASEPEDLLEAVSDELAAGGTGDVLYEVQTQLTADEDMILSGEINRLLGPGFTDLFGYEPDSPTGVDGVPGLWQASTAGVVHPLFDQIERDPAMRDNLNVVLVDHYDKVGGPPGSPVPSMDGFVQAMVALAGDTEPKLHVGSLSAAGPGDRPVDPFIESLPEAQRVAPGIFDQRDSDGGPYNLLPRATGDATLGIDLAAVPRSSTHVVAAWGQASAPAFAPRSIPSGAVSVALVSGMGTGTLSVGTPVVFDDGIGAPAVTVSGDRLWVAYAEKPPVETDRYDLVVRSAPLAPGATTLSAGDFDRKVLVARAMVAGRSLGRTGDDEPVCGSAVFPRPALTVHDGELVLAWTRAIEQPPPPPPPPEGSPPPPPPPCAMDLIPSLGPSPVGGWVTVGRLDPADIPTGDSTLRVPTISEPAPSSSFPAVTLRDDDNMPVASAHGPDLESVGGKLFVAVEEKQLPGFWPRQLRVHKVTGTDVRATTEFWTGDSGPSAGPSETLSLGIWGDDLLVAAAGRGATFDPANGQRTGDWRSLSSSTQWLGLAAPDLNRPPVADAGTLYETVAGTPVVLDGSGSSDPDGDTLTYEWDFDGDGGFDDATGPTPTFTDVSSEGDVTVALRVGDGLEFDTDTATVRVLNAVPRVTGLAFDPPSGVEGSPGAVRADFVDPGDTGHTCAVDWGDGSAATPGTVAGNRCTATHVYADDGDYEVTVIIDDGDASGSASAATSVANAAPVLSEHPPVTVEEGTAVPTVAIGFSDPGTLDTHTATVDWGDGNGPQVAAVAEAPFGPPGSTAGAGGTVALPSHTYYDDGTPQVEVCITDDDGGADCSTFEVTVLNVAPAIERIEVSADSADEGDATTFWVSFDDPGADAHSVRFDWGDGSDPEVVLLEGPRIAAATHRWDDDDPTGTPSDIQQVTVTVTDDDGGADTQGAPEVVVSNVAPDLSVELGDQGGAPLASAIAENDRVAIAGTFTDPSSAGPRGDSFEVILDWGDGTPTESIPIPAGAPREFLAEHQYLDDGAYQVTAVVVDDDTGSDLEVAGTVEVRNLPPVLAVPPSGATGQYSDPLGAGLELTATDVAGYPADPEVLEAAATLDGAPLPAGLELVALGCTPMSGPSQSCSWALSGDGAGTPLLLPPGEHLLEVTVTDDDGGSASATSTLLILPEDAAATYTGAAVVSGEPGGTTPVPLRATVRDISVVDDPATDPWPGDIRNATVTFVDRSSGAVLCEAPAVQLLFEGNEQVGTAWCTWDAPVPEDGSVELAVGIVVGGFYVRDSAADDAVVVVTSSDGFVTGGGYLDAGESMAGPVVPDPGTKQNFGFNAMSGRRGPGGQSNLVMTVGGEVCRVSAIDMLSVGVAERADGTFLAEFQALGGLSGPGCTGGDALLQMRLDDTGPGTPGDAIGWTVYAADGRLLHSSNWDGAATALTELQGEATVHAR